MNQAFISKKIFLNLDIKSFITYLLKITYINLKERTVTY